MTTTPPKQTNQKITTTSLPGSNSCQKKGDIPLGSALAGTVVIRDSAPKNGIYDRGESIFICVGQKKIDDPPMVRRALQQLTRSTFIPAGTRLTALQGTIQLLLEKDRSTETVKDCPSTLNVTTPVNLTSQSSGQAPAADKEKLIAGFLHSRVMAVVKQRRSTLAMSSLYPLTDEPCYAQPLTPSELRQLADLQPDMARVREFAFNEARKVATIGIENLGLMDINFSSGSGADLDFIKVRSWLTVTKICEQLTGMPNTNDERTSVYQESHRVAYRQALAKMRELASEGRVNQVFFLFLRARNYAAEIDQQTHLEHEFDELLTLATSISYDEIVGIYHGQGARGACSVFDNLIGHLSNINRPVINQIKAEIVTRLRTEMGPDVNNLFLALLDRLNYSFGGAPGTARRELVRFSKDFNACRLLLEPQQENFFANAIQEKEALLISMPGE